MGGKTWSRDEERFFWQVIVPRSPKAVRRVDRVSDWEECAVIMQREMGQKARRIYTKLMLFEHYFQNVQTGHKSPCAREFVIYHKRELLGDESGVVISPPSPDLDGTSSDSHTSAASDNVTITPISTSPTSSSQSQGESEHSVYPGVSAWDGPNRHELGGRIIPATTGRLAGSLKRQLRGAPLEAAPLLKAPRLTLEPRPYYRDDYRIFGQPMAHVTNSLHYPQAHTPDLVHFASDRARDGLLGSPNFNVPADGRFHDTSRPTMAETASVFAQQENSESRDEESAPRADMDQIVAT